MDLELLKDFFMWSTIINYAVLFLWALLIRFAKNFFYQQQSSWFPMSQDDLIICNYKLYGAYKLIVIVFNLVPFVVLSILL